PAEEGVEYEYIEAPAAEAPAEEGVEYEYVEAPAAEAPAEEGVEYEYVEAPAAEAPAEEGVEYEYVEEPAAEETASPVAAEPDLPEEDFTGTHSLGFIEEPASSEASADEPPLDDWDLEDIDPESTKAPTIQQEEEEEAPLADFEVDDLEELIEETSQENYAPVTDTALADELESVETPVLTETEDDSVVLTVEEQAEPEVAATPEPEVTVAPEPEITAEPEPEVAATPEPEITAEPEPEVAATPEPEITAEPEPEVTVAPEPEITVEPEPEVAVASEPEITEEPEPAAEPEADVATVAAAAVAGTAAIDALAEKAAEEANEPENDAQIVAEETQEEHDPDEESDTLPATGAYSFDGTQSASFTGSDVMDSIILTHDAHAFDRLSEWYLLVSDFSVTPLEGQNGADVPLSDEVFCQGAFLNADGSQQPFANQTLVTVPADQTNLALCSVSTMPLIEQAASTLELSGASGMLIGPNNVRLMFSRVNKLTVPEIQKQQTEAVSKSGSVIYDSTPASKENKNVFTFTADDGAAETNSENILVKAGYSLYGWNVAFGNGQTMSLADVRTYQTKHGALPDANGTISYGKAQLTFKNAHKISVYEKPSYCGYGKKPE
ncbi:MAG: hypothetical protein J5716_06650, partial [Alphaproteobacteria bacterium]|nr:hypothetical protein [Alphaproteobacteria bacterium]